MKVTSKVFNREIAKINDKAFLSLIETADALHSDVVQSQTMPFESGALQNRGGGVNAHGEKVEGTNLDINKRNKVVSVVSEAPYARRLYFHPEYNFSKEGNPNAGGLWFDPYVSGNKKDFVPKTFAKLMKGKM